MQLLHRIIGLEVTEHSPQRWCSFLRHLTFSRLCTTHGDGDSLCLRAGSPIVHQLCSLRSFALKCASWWLLSEVCPLRHLHQRAVATVLLPKVPRGNPGRTTMSTCFHAHGPSIECGSADLGWACGPRGCASCCGGGTAWFFTAASAQHSST